MATNWPPSSSYPAWPALKFSDLRAASIWLAANGWTKSNPTSQENRDYFRNVQCDEGHPCSGIMIVDPQGNRYPFAYCTGATHKSALVLWVVGISTIDGSNCYDLGWDSGRME